MEPLDKKFYISLGKILNKQRKSMKYTLQYVVDKLPEKYKITKQTLSKYEKGKIRMGNETFNELCKILNLKPSEVLNSIHFD
jgi:transcriptional regulator with XRE-family HTH domain